jgi:tetratricopeptide (TPR) repeat protein
MRSIFRTTSFFAPCSMSQKKATGGKNNCANCGSEDDDALNKCAKCLISFYCSEACQKHDWSIHARTCIPLEKFGDRTIHELALEGDSCCICFDAVGSLKTCLLMCGHKYHNECFLQYVLYTARNVCNPCSLQCPQCRLVLEIFDVGEAFVRSADFDAAEKMYLKLVKLPMASSGFYRALSKVYLACYKLDKSAWAISMAVLSESTVEDVVANKHVEGLIQEKNMQYNAAIDLLKFALSRNPKNVSILFDLGRLLTMAQHYRSAKSCFELVIGLEGSHATARRYLELLPYLMKEVSVPPSIAEMPDPFWGMCLGSYETMNDNDGNAVAIFRHIIRHYEVKEAAGELFDRAMMATAWSYLGRILTDWDECETAFLMSLR